MKFSKVCTLLLVGLTISPFLWAKGSTSTYTNLKNCKLVEEGRDWSVSKCPGYKAYQLYFYYADARDWLVIKKAGKVVIDLQNDIWNQDSGHFPEVPGPVEWRLKGKLVNAIIFRAIYSNGPKKKSKLFVVRLKGKKACLLGTTTSNKRARKMADSRKTCSGQ